MELKGELNFVIHLGTFIGFKPLYKLFQVNEVI